MFQNLLGLNNKIPSTVNCFFLLLLSVSISACGSSGSGGEENPVNTTSDTTVPVITITGVNPLQVQLGGTYTDAGASASDDVDGDISTSIIVSGTVDTAALGSYKITYTVKDAAGNMATAERNVTVFNDVPTALNQAAFVPGTKTYQYGYNSGDFSISGVPADTDRTRWAMLNDGSTFRLYFFKVGSNDTLYQFRFNFITQKYEYGYNSAKILKIFGMPSDANPTSFAMLHDGSDYRLYMSGKNNPTVLYQAAYNPSTLRYEYGYNSSNFNITGAPTDADFTRWAMLNDGAKHRLYMFQKNSTTVLYQFVFTGSAYSWGGSSSIATLSLTGMPATSDTSNFSMLHDGADYRFYFQRK